MLIKLLALNVNGSRQAVCENVLNGKGAARFIEPMLLLPSDHLPEGAEWQYEVKFDGYRALAIKSGGQVRLRSRNDKDFTKRYPGVVAALTEMPDETVIDGEVVALDTDGKPAFSLLQNGGANVHFYVFDVLVLSGNDVTGEPLVKRRNLLESHVLPKLTEPVRCSPVLEASLPDLIQSVRTQGLEGLVAKRANSRYEPGQRSGAWMKMRVNRCEEFVIGGYSLGGSTFDAVIWAGGERKIAVRRADSKRIHAGIAGGITAENEAARGSRMPILQLAGETGREMGRGTHGGQNERLSLAQAGAGGLGRVPGVDGGPALAA